MTQQYIVGECSVLVGELQSAAGERFDDPVASLRHEVELVPPSMLPPLVREAMSLADAMCWAALEQGNVSSFRRCAKADAALWEFAVCADLLC